MPVDSSVNPQPTDAHIRISHEIHRELIRRKFTQRQRDIIDFILTLSWGCGKPSAIIPMLKHFELCGIRKEHIRKELTGLVEMNVILWEEQMNVFQVNKYYDLWKVESVDRFDVVKMNDLIAMNIEMKTPNLTKPVTEKVTQLPKRQPSRVTKKVTQLPKKQLLLVTKKVTELLKRQLDGYQKGNYPVTKKVTLMRNFSCNDAVCGSSKTIIKAIIKKRTTTTTTTTRTSSSKKDYSFGNVFKAYEQNFIAGGKVTEFDVEEFSALFDDYGGEWLLQAMRDAFRQGPDKRNLAYVGGVLKGYRDRGSPYKRSAEGGHSVAAGRPKSLRQQQIDDLDKLIEEEEKKRGTR
ncbi:replication protein [Paenibacillus sp. SYP-B4298]|uniref:replication protein n=1 Tax=Paenibacillus sp. SYP-B4298 TaxID=2996034 RepID=UPI0022DDB812|nr:replication protein [Paenibacillus sp. SYP-B4298]